MREREVMRLAAEGLTNKTIARQLGVSEGTIKLHLHNIYRKLGSKADLPSPHWYIKRFSEPRRRCSPAAALGGCAPLQ